MINDSMSENTKIFCLLTCQHGVEPFWYNTMVPGTRFFFYFCKRNLPCLGKAFFAVVGPTETHGIDRRIPSPGGSFRSACKVTKGGEMSGAAGGKRSASVEPVEGGRSKKRQCGGAAEAKIQGVVRNKHVTLVGEREKRRKTTVTAAK